MAPRKKTKADAEPSGRLAEESIGEILRAAAELFMDLGFAATSIDAIAARIGSTKGRVYHHFSSKAEVYFSIQREGMRIITSAIEPLALEKTDPETRLRNMAFRHVEVILENFPLQKVAVQSLDLALIAESRVKYTQDLREIFRARDYYEQVFCDVIDEGIRAGVFEDMPPRLLAKPFFGALNWITLWYRPRALQSADDIKALAALHADFALRGIRKGTTT